MARVKRGVMTRKRHNRVLKAAEGYYGARRRQFKQAKEAVMHAGQYAFRDRRVRKREFRKLWIARINAACRERGITAALRIDPNRYSLVFHWHRTTLLANDTAREALEAIMSEQCASTLQ